MPSWLASDGTLRLLTLTIPAYLRDLEGTFLIEDPENGIHPRAIDIERARPLKPLLVGTLKRR